MLVLTRRVNESIRIGDDIVVTVVQVSPGKVRIGVQAPDDMLILRDELEAHEEEEDPGEVTPPEAAAL